MLKKIEKLGRIKDVRFAKIDVFKKKEGECRDELNICKKNIESLIYKLKQLEMQQKSASLGADLQNAFQLRVKLETALKEERERKITLDATYCAAKAKLKEKLAEDNAFGKLITKKKKALRTLIEKVEC